MTHLDTMRETRILLESTTKLANHVIELTKDISKMESIIREQHAINQKLIECNQSLLSDYEALMQAAVAGGCLPQPQVTMH